MQNGRDLPQLSESPLALRAFPPFTRGAFRVASLKGSPFAGADSPCQGEMAEGQRG